MTTIQDIFHAFAPEDLERYPNLPPSLRKTLRAICHCRSGPYGHSLYRCQSCGEHHRVHHSCGHRHCPQCQHHKTQQWLQHHLDKQLPGPHCRITFTVPAPLRPFRRSPHRLASQTMCKASSRARKRLAKAARCIGTALPGFPGILHTWGRQLPYHPHMPSIVPGGGLSQDRTQWLASRANFFVPVKALAPIYRAICKEALPDAGLLDLLDPQVWTSPWNVPSQANPNGATSFQYLAPSVFRVALSHSRIVSLKERTVPCSYRQPGRARQRITQLAASALLRRVLQHGLPDGFMKVRPFGWLTPHGDIPTEPLRRMILQRQPRGFEMPDIEAPQPVVAAWPTCGTPMQLVRRLWTSTRGVLDTG